MDNIDKNHVENIEDLKLKLLRKMEKIIAESGGQIASSRMKNVWQLYPEQT